MDADFFPGMIYLLYIYIYIYIYNIYISDKRDEQKKYAWAHLQLDNTDSAAVCWDEISSQTKNETCMQTEELNAQISG